MGVLVFALLLFAALIAVNIWFSNLLGRARSNGVADAAVLRARGFLAICNLGWLLGVALLALSYLPSFGLGGGALRATGQAVIVFVAYVQVVGSMFLAVPLVRAIRSVEHRAP